MIELNIYKECYKISMSGFSFLKLKLNESVYDVQELQKLTNQFIINEISNVFEKYEKKGLFIPVNLSLNNCVSNYIYEPTLKNTIDKNDVIKLDFSIMVDDVIFGFGETIVLNEYKIDDNDITLKFLKKLKSKIVKKLNIGTEYNDIIGEIEAYCDDNKYIPIENCMTRRIVDGDFDDDKIMILNYKMYYNDEDECELNKINFEFENDEVYHMNLCIVKDKDIEYKYKELHDAHLYKFNDNFYNVKLKSTKKFLSLYKQNNTSYFSLHKDSMKAFEKVGLQECIKNDLIDVLPVLYNSHHENVFLLKFTIVITNNKTYIF